MSDELRALVEKHVPLHKVGSEWHGPCPECGTSQTDPKLSDRFSVKPDGHWFCRNCGHGDAVGFLRTFEKLSCPEAHAALGRRCESTTCPAERCRARKGGGARSLGPPQPLQAPRRVEPRPFTPTAAAPPAGVRWQVKAAKLVEHAHQALLAAPEPLAYLAGRGLPRAAVERYRLGWLAETFYRPRKAWGLPDERWESGKPKQLVLPAGLVIPFCDAAGAPVRLRIRRREVREGQARYYHVPGSGTDVQVLGADSGPRAFVVVESDLDAYLVHHHAGDRVGVIPMTTVSAKPKQAAAALLEAALVILVALDFEPRVNERTGKHENPGGKAARWWLQHYPRARRWPVPAGKDPGEYFERGGDVRAWVLAGLPPALQVTAAAPDRTAPAPAEASAEPPRYVRGVSKGGIPYVVAETPEQLAEARREHPEAAPFLRAELAHLRGYTAEELHRVLVAKQTFPEGRVVAGARGAV